MVFTIWLWMEKKRLNNSPVVLRMTLDEEG